MAKYVRLRQGVTAYADLNTGFALTGRDVVEVPEYAEDVVERDVLAGRLIYSSKEDYDAVHDNDVEIEVKPIVAPIEVSHQEAEVRRQLEDRLRKLEERLGEDPEEAHLRALQAQHPERYLDENQRQGRPAKKASKGTVKKKEEELTERNERVEDHSTSHQ